MIDILMKGAVIIYTLIVFDVKDRIPFSPRNSPHSLSV
jgi:hypothetical protein